MSRRERSKGLEGEREMAALWKAAGAEVRGLEGEGDHFVAALGSFGPTIHSEVKRQETARVWAWWLQATAEAPIGTLPIVSFRRNRSRWLSLVDAEALAGLLTELGRLRELELERGGGR